MSEEPKPDYAKLLFAFALGYFVVAPVIVLAAVLLWQLGKALLP